MYVCQQLGTIEDYAYGTSSIRMNQWINGIEVINIFTSYYIRNDFPEKVKRVCLYIIRVLLYVTGSAKILHVLMQILEL